MLVIHLFSGILILLSFLPDQYIVLRCIVHCTVVYCTLYTTYQYTLQTTYYTPYSKYNIVCNILYVQSMNQSNATRCLPMGMCTQSITLVKVLAYSMCPWYGDLLCTVYNILCTVHNIQCTVYNIQYTVYSVHCTVYSVEYTVYTVHYTMYSVQCRVYSVQCTMQSIQCTLYSVHCIQGYVIFEMVALDIVE